MVTRWPFLRCSWTVPWLARAEPKSSLTALKSTTRIYPHRASKTSSSIAIPFRRNLDGRERGGSRSPRRKECTAVIVAMLSSSTELRTYTHATPLPPPSPTKNGSLLRDKRTAQSHSSRVRAPHSLFPPAIATLMTKQSLMP